MLTFADPFERMLMYVHERWGVSARVHFVLPEELPRYGFWRKRVKGMTRFPVLGGVPTVSIDATLDRGVQGTLDILAHELAHVVVGRGHGPEWEAVYEEIFRACAQEPTVLRVCGGPSRTKTGSWSILVEKNLVMRLCGYLDRQENDLVARLLLDELTEQAGGLS